MKATQLRSYQIKAIDAIQEALERNQKHIVIELPAGFGKGLIFAKTVENLNRIKPGKILVATGSISIKKKIEQELSTNFQEFIQVNSNHIAIDTIQRVLKYQEINEYPVIILYDASIPKPVCESLIRKDTTVIMFSTFGVETSQKWFGPKTIVFSYSYQDATNDGYITPAMDEKALEPATIAFSKQLLAQWGYHETDFLSGMKGQAWDAIVCKGEQKIWLECKTYKSQVVSPSAASSLLNTIVMRKTKQVIPQKDIVLLVVPSRIPSFEKDEIYTRFKIIVLDIENLVFYSKNSPDLLKKLSQITYFPLDYIEGAPSKEIERAGLSVSLNTGEIIYESEREDTEARELIQQLKKCKSGKTHSSDYENVCEKIVRTLFEANYFNTLTRQHKTKDEHFRMDLIGSLKINQSNEESMHPLWQMLVQHYNSHFVVFEFKNYSKEIDQNLVYITEKYLFDAALRNVAFIISRKGFSKSAKFAAEGCLKEHGKLILDVTEDDLIKMLDAKSDKAADYLLGKLEEFLMRISK